MRRDSQHRRGQLQRRALGPDKSSQHAPLGEYPRPHGSRIGAIDRCQRGDGARLFDLFDQRPPGHIGEHRAADAAQLGQACAHRLRPVRQMLTQRHRKAHSRRDIGFAEFQLVGHRKRRRPVRRRQARSQPFHQISAHREEAHTPRTGDPLARRGIRDVGTHRAIHLTQRLCGVHDQRQPQLAAQFRDHRKRLHDTAVACHGGQVDQIRWLGFQGKRRVVECHPAVLKRRQQLTVESVGGQHGQVGTVFTGQAGHRPAVRRPAPEQQIQRVQRAGGEHHLCVGHAGQRRERGASSVECGFGGLGRDIPTDFGLEPCVLGGGLEHRQTLPRAGRTVQVQPGDRRAGRSPLLSQRLAIGHLAANDRPKSPALSVHHRMPRNPASAKSARTPSGWNLHETSVSISSPASNSTSKSSAPTRTRW